MKTLKLTAKKSRTAAAVPAPVVFLHARPLYPRTRSAAVFGLAELGDDRIWELRPRGEDASCGFVLVACDDGETHEVEPAAGGGLFCSCRSSALALAGSNRPRCFHVAALVTLHDEGSI